MNPEYFNYAPKEVAPMTDDEKAATEAAYWADPVFHSELAPLAGSALLTSPDETLVSSARGKEIK